MDPGSDLSAQSYGSLGRLMDGMGRDYLCDSGAAISMPLEVQPASHHFLVRLVSEFHRHGIVGVLKIIIQKEAAFFEW